ncbi:hypothetical protein [Actinacidiphila sp. bgisy160]|uniref:hypothetical protein n=1 Tax=Actinacidiphila sp. bgisy160 TaxID=3413796 RepID=UPI003D715F3B
MNTTQPACPEPCRALRAAHAAGLTPRAFVLYAALVFTRPDEYVSCADAATMARLTPHETRFFAGELIRRGLLSRRKRHMAGGKPVPVAYRPVLEGAAA